MEREREREKKEMEREKEKEKEERESCIYMLAWSLIKRNVIAR
jgi:hypothetical protein